MINMNSKINENLNTLKSMAFDARNALMEMRATFVAWNEEAFRAIVMEDAELTEGLINELRGCGFETTTLEEGRKFVTDLIENLGETAREMNEAQRELTLQNLFGGTSRHCSECHAPMDNTDEFCPYCGSKEGALKPYVEPQRIECTACKCGRTYDKTYRFCPSCGKANPQHELNKAEVKSDIFNAFDVSK